MQQLQLQHRHAPAPTARRAVTTTAAAVTPAAAAQQPTRHSQHQHQLRSVQHPQHLQQQQQQQQQQQHQSSSSSSRRDVVSALALAAPALLWPLSHSAAEAAQQQRLPPVQDPASNVGYLSNKEVDKRRKRAAFVRAYDGHVSLQHRYSREWVDVKLDLQVPGLLLLRDSSGEVFYQGYRGMKQIDLSDDQVVAAIATGNWEDTMVPVEGPGESGEIERLTMTREGFYQLVSLTSGEDFEAELLPASDSSSSRKKQ